MSIIKVFIYKLNKFYHLESETITRKQALKTLAKVFLPIIIILPLPWILPLDPNRAHYTFISIWFVLLIIFGQFGGLILVELRQKKIEDKKTTLS